MEHTNNFADALHHLMAGGTARREGWNGKGMWIELQVPDEHSKMTLPYIFLTYPECDAYPGTWNRVPWLASQTDLLSSDWILMEKAG